MKLLRKRGLKLLVDISLFVGFVVEFLTREPDFDADYILHSWVGIVLIPVIGIHLSGNWTWVKRVARNRGQDHEFTLGALNLVLGSLATICIISGFPLWFEWSEAGWLAALHQVTGLVAILLMFVHLWMNRRRLVSLTRPRPSRA